MKTIKNQPDRSLTGVADGPYSPPAGRETSCFETVKKFTTNSVDNVPFPAVSEARRPQGAGRGRRSGRDRQGWRAARGGGGDSRWLPPRSTPELRRAGGGAEDFRRPAFLRARATSRGLAGGGGGDPGGQSVRWRRRPSVRCACSCSRSTIRWPRARSARGRSPRGGVTVAVSTDGRAPALAGLLREGLEALLPDELETWTAEAERQRRVLRAAASRWPSAAVAAGARSSGARYF